MNIKESEEKKCLICLEEDASVHWNTILFGYSDLTYKDCYYKYTQLENFDTNDEIMFCRNCCNSLEYIDAFITKAIASRALLRERFDCNKTGDNEKELMNGETISIERSEIEFETQYDIENGDCSEEIVLNSSENDTCSSSEAEILDLKHTRKRRKLKSANKEEQNIGNSAEKTSSEKIARKSAVKDQPICCTICSRVLCSKYAAIKHEKTHIENRERNETCVICGTKYLNKATLRSHMKTHSENREKSHKCEFCEKAFFNRGALNVHRRIHLGQMIPCPICSREFYRKIDMESHLSTHSAEPLQKNSKKKLKYRIQCQYCNKEVPSQKYRGHKAAHLGQPAVKCKICDKNFFDRSRCAEHLRRLHKKNKEYDEFIHYYVKYDQRVSHLLIKQQEIVKPLTSITDE